MKTYNLSDLSSQPEYVFCPHCAAKNSRKSYCCLTCYKVMFPHGKLGFFRANIHPAISFLAILTALVLTGLYLGNKWLEAVEANISLNVKTRTYDLSMTAEKRKGEELKQDISLEKNPSE